jgi:hypothetical protein
MGSVVAAGERTVMAAVDDAALLLGGAARGREARALAPQEAERFIDRVLECERYLTALKLQAADVFADAHGAKAADDLARKSRTSKGKAKGTLETAKKVKESPEVEDAVRNGELSEEQASLIADASDVNPSAAGDLVKRAKNGSINDLRQECSRAKAAADADEEETHRRVHRNRRFRTGTNTDPAFWGSLYGTTADGAELMAHLQPFRERLFQRNRKAGIHLTSEQLDFDALTEMARAAYANVKGAPVSDGDEAIPMPPPPKAPKNVYVVVDFDAMVDRAEPGEDTAYIAGFGPVPVSVVRECMDNPFLVGVVMKGTEVAKIKRFGRRFGPEIRDALLVKQRFRCSTPGCTNWLRIELDHVQPYAKDGPTTYDNGDGKCDTCHDDKTRQDRLNWDDTG